MSLFKVNVSAVNPAEPDKYTLPLEVLVDTDSELTWLPKDVLEEIGIFPRRKRDFNCN